MKIEIENITDNQLAIRVPGKAGVMLVRVTIESDGNPVLDVLAENTDRKLQATDYDAKLNDSPQRIIFAGDATIEFTGTA